MSIKFWRWGELDSVRKGERAPNSGWSEAAVAGAWGRELGGPAWYEGVPGKTDWIGDDTLPSSATEKEIRITSIIILLTSAQTAISRSVLASNAARSRAPLP
ncbi:MAG: cobalamin biosynthesis protein [Kiritimatiellaeota bacterium]|nr:cobalamin biosynthesis protein [Kiritimatiellota bacterium]